MSLALRHHNSVVVSAIVAVCLLPRVAAAQTSSPFSGTPAAIPGIIEAENFDLGGEGVGYHDIDAVNDGGQYRGTEGVDIFTSSGAPGGYVIKNFPVGEWMAYTVQVAANGWYDFQVRMASKVDTARFHIEIDGIDVTGPVAVPITSTTTWEAYQWFVVKKRVPLTAGTHLMKVVSDATWVGLDAFNITASPVGTPFGGTPARVPGTIQAENFNEGGQGVAYNDTDAINEGSQYRPSEGVDIFTSSGAPGGYVIKNFATGEWMVYTVNVSTTGMYDFKVRVATKLDTSKLHIEVDGVDVTGTVAVPSTSTVTWEAYQWIVARALVPLEAGPHNLAIVSDEQWVGLDAIEIAASPSRPFSGTPAAVPGVIEAEDFDLGGEGVAYHDTDAVNEGGQYRTAEGVDLFTSSGAPGSYVVKNFATGEWMAYSINVQATGKYDFKVRLATKLSTSTFHIEIDGTDVTGTVAVPSTSSVTWEAYQWHTAKTNVSLSSGTHVLKIVSDQEWVGLDELEIVASAAPRPNPPGLLFSSGYEGVTLGTPRNCSATRCMQDILGTDSMTGFAWPPNLFGGNNAFEMRTGNNPTPTTIRDSMFNELRTGEGRNGSRGLYTEVRLNNSGQYNAYAFYPTSEVAQLYVSYWVKFQPDFVQKLHAGDEWRNIFEWKSAGDFRISVGVVAWNLSTPRWQVSADNNANGGLPVTVFWRENTSGVAVPIDEWFKLEIFWRRGTGAADRIWAAVNGQKIVDRFGSLMGVNNAPINRIFTTLLYTGSALPVYQRIDDVQIWSDFPTAQQGDPAYDPPYGPH